MVNLTSYGLLDDLPGLSMIFGRRHFSATETEYLWLIEPEISWDGAPWKPMMRSFITRSNSGSMNFTLDNILEPPQLQRGLHVAQFRATFTRYTPALDGTRPTQFGVMEPQEQEAVLAELGEPLFRETRDLGRHETMIFLEYPQDFPYEREDQSPQEIAAFARIDTVRVWRTVVPGPANMFGFTRHEGTPNNSTTGTVMWPVVDGLTPGDTVAVYLELVGRLREDIPVQLAGRMELWVPRQPLLDLPWYFGPTIKRVGHGSTADRTRLDFVTLRGLADGHHRASVRMIPSRRAAREDKVITDYYARIVPQTVVLDLRTIENHAEVEAEWRP